MFGERAHNGRGVPSWKFDEHRKSAVALDEGGDVRIVRSGKKVSFPMARHSTILDLGWPLADRDHIDDLSLSTLGVAAFGVAHPPCSTQMCRQLFLQHAAGLNEEAAIDRFVR